MEKKARPWVFPTVKFLVNLIYYSTFFACLPLAVFFIFQTATIQPVNGYADSPFVGVPVEWNISKDEVVTKWSSADQVNLVQEKSIGSLHIPLRSMTSGVYLLYTAVRLLLFLMILYFLRKIFKSTTIASPFSAVNAQYISAIGIILIVLDVIVYGFSKVFRPLLDPYIAQLSNTLNFDTFEISPGIEGSWFLGLILLALAQVYRRGIELQVENELTV